MLSKHLTEYFRIGLTKKIDQNLEQSRRININTINSQGVVRLVYPYRTFHVRILAFLLIESECVLDSLDRVNFCRSDFKKSSIQLAQSQNILESKVGQQIILLRFDTPR